MEFEKQKPITDAYRKGWERIWGAGNMPFVSKAQQGYFNANKPALEKKGVDVDEWNAASKGKELPEHKDLSTMRKPLKGN